MILMAANDNTLAILVLLTALCWIIPIVMLIVGLVRLRKHPKSSKILLIISGIWLLIGIGFCGMLMV